MLENRPQDIEHLRGALEKQTVRFNLAQSLPISYDRPVRDRNAADTPMRKHGFTGADLLLALNNGSDDPGQPEETTNDFNRIRRDARRRITEVTPDWSHHRDRKLKIDYNTNDNPNEVTFADQGVLRRRNGKWELLDKNGDKTDTIPGFPKIDAGKIVDVEMDQKTAALTLKFSDDSTMTKYADGSVIARNSDGKPTRILSARDFFSNSGREISVEYANGKEQQVAIGDAGGTLLFQKQADGSWLGGQINPKTKEVTHFPSVRDVTVDREQGTVYVDLGAGYSIKAESPQGKKVEGQVKRMVFAKDGTKRLELQDGTIVTINAEGGVTNVRTR
ncbi:MAG: hypothetical protein C5B53_00460 [Candidatus Melainabacteria bacterium]|nr:MAG: hypothetical protein C5B53_00460 [Candidatus Melainabacteria bacterium]